MNNLSDYLRVAFGNDPLFVTPSLAKMFFEQNFFIPVAYYAPKYMKKLVAGEIGIHDFRRIIISLPVPKGATAKRS